MRRLSFGFVVDHPKRDLPTAVSFARALVERGCDAYLIPLYDQAVDVPLLPLDGIVVNFARPANIDLVTGYCDAGLPVYVLDTEGGNQTEAGANTPERLAQLLKERGFSERLSGYFFWGPRLRDAFVGSSGMQSDALVATGCPRFDYTSKRWRDVLDYLTDDYVLVNANFPLVNPRFVTSEAREREAAVHAGWDSDYMKRLVEDMTGVFKEFMATVARLARDMPTVQFIVRPHPFENQDVYEQAFSGFANVKVDGTGPVLNVLAHARCLLHLNCATAVEATMLERLPVSMEYLNTSRLLSHAPLPSRISRHAQSYEELLDLVANSDAHAASFPFAEHYREMIFPWFFENDGRAADRMADFMIGRTAPKRRPVSVRRSLASSRRDPKLLQRAQALFANLVGSRTASRLRAKFQSVRRDKVFTPSEVAQSISLLCRAEGVPLPDVTQARHPVTGFPLASVVCHAPGALRP
jgi:surface carbohydrate biosynthesis protein